VRERGTDRQTESVRTYLPGEKNAKGESSAWGEIAMGNRSTARLFGGIIKLVF